MAKLRVYQLARELNRDNAEIIRELQHMGVQLSVDDFGTGYSSLSYLKRFPVQRLKIDKSFVDNVGRRKDSDAIIRAVTGIAESLGIETVAEGVETAETAQILRELGCTLGQGYYFSRPLPGREFTAWMRENEQGLTVRPRSLAS